MALVLKSNRVATASLGNINGINEKQDWSIFLDFENEIYQTKKNGIVNQNYLLSDVVEVSRANLNGAPISISKNGIERNIISTTEIRTALLKNGRFGLLVEDINENFFKNSATPVTQQITLPANTFPIVVSCIGSGSVTVTGGISESGLVVTNSSPKVFSRVSTNTTTDITVTVAGTLSHVQVELGTGIHTASSKVTTTSVNATRAREIAKVKKPLFSDIVKNNSAFTVVIQTVDYDVADNQSKNTEVNRLSLENSNKKLMTTSGNGGSSKYFSRFRFYTDNALTKSSPISLLDSTNDRFYAYTDAISLVSGTSYGASNGVFNTGVSTGVISVTDLVLGAGYGSPIGMNGLRGIVTKLAVYDRVLSDVELIAISKSWA